MEHSDDSLGEKTELKLFSLMVVPMATYIVSHGSAN
jgi:hypothetical protein